MADEVLESVEEEEKVAQLLKITSDSFKREEKTIPIKGIAITQPLKLGRKGTMHGLTATIRDLGVVTPIHVMTVDEDSKDEDYQYILLDGVRRLYGALKNGHKEIDAVVWDFEDKDNAMDFALVLSLVLNRTQKHSWAEVWQLYKILEMQDSFTPSALEYLLQLESGDAMKLKDVMLCDYDEVRLALTSGEKGLDACYKLLQKLRKEEDALLRDDITGVGELTESAEEVVGDTQANQLSDEDVRELLEMTDNLDDLNIGSDDFDSLTKADASFVDQQKVGERHPLDPELRNAVLQRDNFTCHCCGRRLVGALLGTIAVHHKLPVHVGGKDVLENLITLCTTDHISLHVMERNGGSILMDEDTFNALPENEQTALKRALKLARVAIEADKRRGMSKEDVKQATVDAIRHPMPGAGLKENQQAYAVSQKSKDSKD